MDHGQERRVAPGLELEGHITGAAEGEGELARRIERGDLALDPMLGAKAFRPIAGRQGSSPVAWIESVKKNNRGLVDLRDWLRYNETKQRICALPVGVLK